MINADEIMHQAEQLPTAEKWRLVKRLLMSLESSASSPQTRTDWHTFLRETYGSLRDTPIERADQGDYEEREPLE
jgi:hypothetical protein